MINSLSGEAIPASLKLLKPFGRFIELGKRDQYIGTGMDLQPFLRGLTYSAAHLDVLMLEQPEAARMLLDKVWADLPLLPTLPVTEMPMKELDEAIEFMSKGTHIGKVVIRVSAVPVSPALPAIVGPPDDAVVRSLRTLGGRDGKAVVIPDFVADVPELLEGARAVITRSRAVAAWARSLGVRAVELRTWSPPSAKQLALMLRHEHVVAVTDRATGSVHDWLPRVLEETVGEAVDPERPLESYGIDSLAMISLARRITLQSGRPVSVTDLFEHRTLAALLRALGGSVPRHVARRKVLCLHGFRSNKEMLQLQLVPFARAAPEFEFLFVNAARPATGPSDPRIPPSVATFEWWGVKDTPYELAWQSGFEGFAETVSALSQRVDGVVGFSQGAAMATLVKANWAAFFSAVVPPQEKRLSDEPPMARSSFHCYDEQEEVAEQCAQVAEMFTDASVVYHNEGHVVPKDAVIVKRFREFLDGQALLRGG